MTDTEFLTACLRQVREFPPEVETGVVGLAARGLALAQGNRVLKSDLPAAKVLGQDIEAAGGFVLMQLVYRLVSAAWNDGRAGGQTEADFHPGEFNMAWDGIGEWRC